MRYLFSILLLLSFLLSFDIQAQRVIEIPSRSVLSRFINGDTTIMGERINKNTIYELEMNGIYYCASAISIDSKLHIRAKGGAGFLPAILPQKDNSNNWPMVINNAGDVTLEGVYLSNKNGEDANPKWGGFRISGKNARVVLRNCQFEFDKASTIQFRADGIKLYVENCIASKTGNYREFNGNGRFIDTRGYKTDTIVVKNTTVYYMQDRLIRNMGGEINYFEFDHVTVVNNQGMHGCFAMAKVHHAKITNNLIINGMYGGNNPNVIEQTGPYPDNQNLYMITIDTIFSDTKLEIHHNNFAITKELEDFFGGNDTVLKPEILAPLVVKAMGNRHKEAYFEEPVEFANVPSLPIDFLRSIYSTPEAQLHPNNWPDNIGINNIDAGYSKGYVSAKAAEGNKQLGDLNWSLTSGVFDNKSSCFIDINVYPNPIVKSEISLTVELQRVSDISIYLQNINGQVVREVNVSNAKVGSNAVNIDVKDVYAGIYFVVVKTNYGVGNKKIIIQR
jgi:hypothetical protein